MPNIDCRFIGHRIDLSRWAEPSRCCSGVEHHCSTRFWEAAAAGRGQREVLAAGVVQWPVHELVCCYLCPEFHQGIDSAGDVCNRAAIPSTRPVNHQVTAPRYPRWRPSPFSESCCQIMVGAWQKLFNEKYRRMLKMAAEYGRQEERGQTEIAYPITDEYLKNIRSFLLNKFRYTDVDTIDDVTDVSFRFTASLRMSSHSKEVYSAKHRFFYQKRDSKVL